MGAGAGLAPRAITQRTQLTKPLLVACVWNPCNHYSEGAKQRSKYDEREVEQGVS
jgi:hypothetical protein